MKYFSMFSGIGGFEYGICNAYRSKDRRSQADSERNKGQGFQPTQSQEASSKERSTSECYNESINERPLCVGFSELDKYAIQIYKKHFPNHKEYGDVTKIDWSTVSAFDLLVGGFPCQSFSIAGRRGGFKDTRGTLFFEIARCLREKQPRLFLLENVKGLLSHDKGNTFLTILTTLDELGYDLQWQVLNSKNFGVPQNRERVFIVGHLRGTSRPEVFPIGRSYEKDNGAVQRYISNTLTARYEGAQATGTYIGEGELNAQKIRRLTPTECERLQGFPDGWTEFGVIYVDKEKLKKDREKGRVTEQYQIEKISDTQRYKCLGNAVTTNVITAIIEKILTS